MGATRESGRTLRFFHETVHDVYGQGGVVDAMFHPKTIAVVGSTTSGTLGHRTLAALTGHHFEGSVVVVDPHSRESGFGVRLYPTFQGVPARVDLAVVVTPGRDVVGAVDECAAAGVKGVAVLTRIENLQHRDEIERHLFERVRQSRMRMIGPGCCALMNPSVGLNVSPQLPLPVPGSVAFIGQSGSLATTVLDWSRRGIVGFSAFVSLGRLVDVGWGNLIDYFGRDPNTHSILIHMESIVNMRSFLSAAREVALRKPIIVVKAGRTEKTARAFTWHSSCTVSDDDVLDAAFRRVGVLRVDSVEDLFNTADALSKQPRPKGPRLAVVSNAGGPGVLAADQVATNGGELTQPAALAAGIEAIGDYSEADTPMDLLGNGTSAPFLSAVKTAIDEAGNDGVLAVLVPQAMADAGAAIQGLVAMDRAQKPVLLCIIGGPGGLAQTHEILAHARFPVLSSVEAAARTFDHMWRYSHNLRSIYETPELHADVTERASIRHVEEIIMNARRAGRDLIEHEWKEVLAVYGFPTLEGPAHQTSGGTPGATSAGAPEITSQAGVNWDELQIGSRIDPEFGPVLWFGLGGRSAELCAHQVVALPPLNATLARRMLERSPFFTGLKAQADRGQLSLTTLDAALVRLSQLVIEHPGIKAMQIAPLVVSTWGAFARNARIELHGPELDEDHLPKSAFRPFPARYVSEWVTKRGDTVTLRPIRAEDEPLIAAFHARLSDETVYQRYLQVVKLDRRTAHEALIQACFVDYDREMVLVAERRDPSNGARSILAVANLTKLPRKKKAEISVLVSDAYQRHGLGFELVRRLVDVARDERLEQVEATTMADNRGMCAVFERLGFTLSCDDADGSVVAVLALANH